MNVEEEALPRIRAEHQGCDELCDVALLLREVDRLTEEKDGWEETARTARMWQKRAEADLADEKRRHAELRAGFVLLHALWDHVWNGPGSLDYGDHCGYSWEDDQKRSDLASAVEDFYLAHPGLFDQDGALLSDTTTGEPT